MDHSPQYTRLHRRATSHTFGSPYLYPFTPSPPPRPPPRHASYSEQGSPRRSSFQHRSPPVLPRFPSLTVSTCHPSATYALKPMSPYHPFPSFPSPPPLSLTSSPPASPTPHPPRRGVFLLTLFLLLTVSLSLLVLTTLPRSPPPPSPLLLLFPASSLSPTWYSMSSSDQRHLPTPTTWMTRDRAGHPVASPSPLQSHHHHVHALVPSPSSPAFHPPSLSIVTLIKPMTTSSLLTSPLLYHTQYAALLSLSVLSPSVTVYVDAASSCAHLRSIAQLSALMCRVVPRECYVMPYNKPTMDCILLSPLPSAAADFLVYVNGDVVVHPMLLPHLSFLTATFTRFVAVSRRTDVLVSASTLLQHNLTALLTAGGGAEPALHSDYGVDLFVLPTRPPLRVTVPPYLAGVYRWDNDLLAQALLDDVDTIDITNARLLTHPTVAGPISTGEEHGRRKGAEYNERLSAHRPWKHGRTTNARWALPCSSSPKDRSCELRRREESPELRYLRHSRRGWVTLFHVRGEEDVAVLSHFVCAMAEQRHRGWMLLSVNGTGEQWVEGEAKANVLRGTSVSSAVYELLGYGYGVLYLTAHTLYLSAPPVLVTVERAVGADKAGDVWWPAGSEAVVARSSSTSLAFFHRVRACEETAHGTFVDCLTKEAATTPVHTELEGVVPEDALWTPGHRAGIVRVVTRGDAGRATGMHEWESGWRRWEREGLMLNVDGGRACRAEEDADVVAGGSTFTFHVRAAGEESDALMLLLAALDALQVTEETVHLLVTVASPSPRLTAFLQGMQWPHGRLTVSAAEGALGDEGYHVYLSPRHIVGERTMALLSAFVRRWGGEDGHPRLLGVTLSSERADEQTAFTVHQRPSAHSYLLFPRHLPAVSAINLSSLCAVPSSALPHHSALAHLAGREGLSFIHPPHQYLPLLHTATERVQRTAPASAEVDEWRLPAVESMRGVDADGHDVADVWELKARGRWYAGCTKG